MSFTKTTIAVLALAASVLGTGGCATDALEPDASEDGEMADLDGADGAEGADEGDDGDEATGTSAEALKAKECSISLKHWNDAQDILYFKTTGRCSKAKGSTLNFRLMRKGASDLPWEQVVNDKFNVPDNGPYATRTYWLQMGGAFKVYAEATVCWTDKIRRCRSRSFKN